MRIRAGLDPAKRPDESVDEFIKRMHITPIMHNALAVLRADRTVLLHRFLKDVARNERNELRLTYVMGDGRTAYRMLLASEWVSVGRMVIDEFGRAEYSPSASK